MGGKTLFLNGIMGNESILKHLRQALNDLEVMSLHLSGVQLGSCPHDDGRNASVERIEDLLSIGEPQDSPETMACQEEEILDVLRDLFSGRRWFTVHFQDFRGSLCRDLIQMVATSNVRHLRFSPSNGAIDEFLAALEDGIVQRHPPSAKEGSSKPVSLVTLGLHKFSWTQRRLEQLTRILSACPSLMELSLADCNFPQHLSLGTLSDALATSLPTLQHLNVQNCQLSDIQCSTVIQSLRNKRSLMDLTLDGNQCISEGLRALGNWLPSSNLLVLDLCSQRHSAGKPMELSRLSKGLPNSKVRCLQLSDNVFDRDSLPALSQALRDNDTLRVLHLSWCKLTEADMVAVANALRFNTRLSKLILYECGLDNASIFRLALRLRQCRGLKRLDLGGFQRMDEIGRAALLQGMTRNTELDALIMTPAPRTTPELVFWCDVNRVGRRFLQSKETAPAALWPRILARTQTCIMPKIWDTWYSSTAANWSESNQNNEDNDTGDAAISIAADLHQVECEETRRASALYYLLQNGPLLEQR